VFSRVCRPGEVSFCFVPAGGEDRICSQVSAWVHYVSCNNSLAGRAAGKVGLSDRQSTW
jgi:hypothetical protein